MVLYLAATAAVVVEYSRRLILFTTYNDPCDPLLPPWIIVVVRGIGYTYSISFPLWHLAVFAERAWATIRPAEFEKSGCVYAVIAAGIVWSYSLCHVAFLVYLSYQDESFRSGSPFLSLTAKSSANECNAGLVAMSLGIVLRQQRLLFAPDKFQALLELSTLVTWLRPPVSLLAYMRFCKVARRRAVIVEQHAQSDLFFEQFRRQIGTADASERRTSF